jgi:hypothetical protein
LSVASLVTLGIGPGTSIPLVLTEGLYQGTAPPPVVRTGGHWLPLTKKQIEAASRRARRAEEARANEWDRILADQKAIHDSIMATLHPERIIGLPQAKVTIIADDPDEDDLEVILLHA